MRDLHFAAPQHVHWIWILLGVLGLLVWLEGRGSAALDRFLSRVMRRRLVQRPSRTRRLLRIGLLGLSGVALILSLMRPQFGLRFVRTPRVGAEVMVCLDVSKSMLAADVAPSRLGRAKVEIEDLLRFLDGDHVGLIAFAGKATVLCPLTPDFGFLKISLKNAGPQSVARGGTNLEAPIRKAVAGFRGEADVSRAILLITDGEDHDSFPLDAAKAAAERGIRILAIGFGDEAGSEIRVEDPHTGARETLRDADGKPVVSRLDGETLREMALATGGAYIPAGTGALDLESIHEAHIARLTRGAMDGRGRMVRSEGFQWAVLAALVLLVAAVAVTGSRPRRARWSPATVTPLLLFAALMLTAMPAQAEEADAPVAAKRADDEGADARTRYNRGVEAFEAGDLDEAARHFQAARQATGSDGEARYAAAYDLGWVEVRRAEAKLEPEPEAALGHLHAAADWFRDAVRLRPERRAARANLEIITRRILELADALAKQDPRDVAGQIDALIKSQRTLMPPLAEAVQRERAQLPDEAARLSRNEYRRLAVEQRKILADLSRLAAKVREEAEALALRKKDEQTPESRIRAVQLMNASHFLERASQRLGQGRSQLRRKHAARAFRRGSAGLDELKRGRDQFRPPVELLGVLIGEGMRLVRQTGGLAAAKSRAAAPGTTPGESEQRTPEPPAWLDIEHLRERQGPQTERLEEFLARLNAALEGHEKSKQEPKKGAESAPPAGGPEEAQAEMFMEQARAALPFLETAKKAYDGVPMALDAEDLRAAFDAQGEALDALIEARERFLDVKGLIEVTFAEEKRLQQTLEEARTKEEVPLAEVLPLLSDLQRKNHARGPRLAALIEEEKAKLPPVPEQTEPGNEEARKTLEARKQHLELATTLHAQAFGAMGKAVDALQRAVRIPAITKPEALAEAPPVLGAKAEVDEAVKHLENLRRLFFTVVEHLRETLRRQLELNDETQVVAALEDAAKLPEALAPLGETQTELRALAQGISEALEAQAAQDPAAAAGTPPDPQAQQQAQAMAEAMRKAAGLVAEGGTAMEAVLGHFAAGPPRLKPAREQQNTAAEKLAEALALLQPPQQDKQQQKQQQQQQENEQKQEKKEQKEEADPARLLQAVRDREAQRRREKEKRRAAGYEPVEKDW